MRRGTPLSFPFFFFFSLFSVVVVVIFYESRLWFIFGLRIGGRAKVEWEGGDGSMLISIVRFLELTIEEETKKTLTGLKDRQVRLPLVGRDLDK